MELFLTIESNAGMLLEILRRVNNEISFVTDRAAGLESADNYGTEFRNIGIIPTCMSDDLWEASGWRERKFISRKNKEADIRLRIDYDHYLHSSSEDRRLLFIDIIIKSIRVVQERSKGDFRGEDLIADILKAVDVTESQLRELNERGARRRFRREQIALKAKMIVERGDLGNGGGK